MYANILIPTDGSELAWKAVQHGIALAKRIGARITALTVLPPFHTFTTDPQMIEDTPDQYEVRMQKHAEKTLAAAAQAAQAAGVASRQSRWSMSIPIRRSSTPRGRKTAI
jgi:nucleotide-binding universal stress UspA family protein